MNRLNNRQSARVCVLVTVGFAFLTMALSSHASEIVLPTDTAASVEAPPSAPPPPPTTPPAPTTPHPKLAKEVADYKETMVEMQRELAEFKRYYDPSPKLSRLGQWSNQIPHLNAAWTAKVRASHAHYIPRKQIQLESLRNPKPSQACISLLTRTMSESLIGGIQSCWDTDPLERATP